MQPDMTGRGTRNLCARVRLSRPSHSTVVAYVALFIALGTGASWAATKIKSSAQIKRGVVKGSDIKDGNVDGRDIRDAGLSGADLRDGTLTGAHLADATIAPQHLIPDSVGSQQLAPGAVGSSELSDSAITGIDVLDGGLSGADLGDDSVKGADVDESTLSFGKGFSSFQAGTIGIHNGGGFSIPVSPQGDIAVLALPPGRYLIFAHAAIAADGDGGSAFCLLNAADQSVETGNDVSSLDFGPSPSGISGISVSTIAASSSSFAARLVCSDDGSAVTANDRGLEAIRLNG